MLMALHYADAAAAEKIMSTECIAEMDRIGRTVCWILFRLYLLSYIPYILGGGL